MAKRNASDDEDDDDYEPSKAKKPSGRPRGRPSSSGGYVKKEGATSLPTPDPTATDTEFSSHFPPYLKTQVQPATPTYQLNGMLRHEDEVLTAQLNYSRRGSGGHCSRDTADLWGYILGLFFAQQDGYEIRGSNYKEQEILQQYYDDAVPSGQPVIVEVRRISRFYNPMMRTWVLADSVPVLTIICAGVEDRFNEYPSVRQRIASKQSLEARTPLQMLLYKELARELTAHNQRAKEGASNYGALKSLNGAVACGTEVRFHKLKADEVGMGIFRPWTAKGVDLVNGDPSCSLSSVEKILMRIRDPGMKGRAMVG